jgi:hypothetical protein
MPYQPLSAENSPRFQAAVHHVMLAVHGLQAREQVETLSWLALGLMEEARFRCEHDPGKRHAYDAFCSDMLAWFRQEIEALRFQRSH